MADTVSLKELLEAGAHFGHQARRWNPRIKPYIFDIQEGIHVFDLTKTKEKLEEALEFLKKSAKEGKSILFVGTKKQAKENVKEVAEKTGQFFVKERWLGGTLTNFEQIHKSLKKLEEMRTKRKAGDYKRFTKKERLDIDREIERLERFFGGLSGLERLPDILVIIDIKKEEVAIREALMTEVKTVALVDSNTDPTLVDYPIPMNDDATRAVAYVLDLMGKAILKGSKSKSKSKGQDSE